VLKQVATACAADPLADMRLVTRDAQRPEEAERLAQNVSGSSQGDESGCVRFYAG